MVNGSVDLVSFDKTPEAHRFGSHHDGRNQLVDFRFPCRKPRDPWKRRLVGPAQPPEKLRHPNKASCPGSRWRCSGTIAPMLEAFANNANVRVVYGLEGDYDGGSISVDDTISRLESHNIRARFIPARRTRRRNRAGAFLAPLNSPCPPEQRGGRWRALNGAWAACWHESFTLSQSYYYGQVDRHCVAVTFDNPDDGVCIDELPELDAIAKRAEFPLLR